MLNGISIEAKFWEKSAAIAASVNSAKILNPFNSQIIHSSKKVCMISLLCIYKHGLSSFYFLE